MIILSAMEGKKKDAFLAVEGTDLIDSVWTKQNLKIICIYVI